MKIVCLVILVCAMWEARGYPYYPYYGSNVDSLSFGASDSSRGGMVYSRYYNPYYNPRAVGGGMAAFMFKQPQEQPTQQVQPSQYYMPDRRRQSPPEPNYLPPQENEVYYPQASEKPFATEATEIADPTDRNEVLATTVRTVTPELVEPEIEEIEEPVQKPKKRVSKKKQVRKPVEEEDEEDDMPRMPAEAFFPMFFGWGGRASGGHGHGQSPGGAIAIANAYGTGRGGVASSHATAYGAPRPDTKMIQ